MTDRLHQALATAIGHLEWFAIPHTVDQIIGLYSEALAGATMRYRHGLSNEELVERIQASATGAGGMTDPAWSDPTGDTVATHVDRTSAKRTDDTDGTLGAIDSCLRTMGDAARELDHLGADATTTQRWHPPASGNGRQGTLAVIVARLHHAAPTLDAANQLDPDLVDELVRTHIAESAAWLHEKATEIWRASRGEAMPVAVQRPIVECSCCSPWRKGTIAQARGLCQQCNDFDRNHGCRPTEAIVRRWDYGKGATPAQVLEAKAASRKRRRSAAS